MGVTEILLLIGFAIVVVVVMMVKEQRLQDPERLDTIYVNQMREVCNLANEPVVAALTRQSGNIYRELGGFDNVGEALHEIEKSFRRGQIESVYVQTNSERRFEVIRLHHSHGGKAEGKKLGGAIIELA